MDQESVRRRLRLGAEQELSRARADLELALETGAADTDAVGRLEQIEQQLRELRASTSVLTKRRNRRMELGLVLSERLLLDQLGFDSFSDYAGWRAANPHLPSDRWDDDPAYAEFAQVRVDLAEARLAAIDAGDLDPEAIGSPDAAPEGAEGPLEAWTEPAWSKALAPARVLPAAANPAMPDPEVIGVATLDLPYWTDPA